MHLAIGTPMFGGQCSAQFNRSLGSLALRMQAAGARTTPIHIGNESLINRARNMIAWLFLHETEASHLLWCDADTGFRVDDVARMIGADKDMIVAPVPMKRIHWERVAKAVMAGVPHDKLHLYSGHFNINNLDGHRIESPDQPFRIKHGGTGFMLMKRGVFEALAPSTEDYVSDDPGGVIPKGARVKNFFPTQVAGDRLLSEDFALCANWTKAGGEVWCAPWVKLSHVGTYAFEGEYALCH